MSAPWFCSSLSLLPAAAAAATTHHPSPETTIHCWGPPASPSPHATISFPQSHGHHLLYHPTTSKRCLRSPSPVTITSGFVEPHFFFHQQEKGPSVTKEMDLGSKNEDVVGYNTSTAKKARLQSVLSALLDDPILSDVPKKPMLADVDTLINLELGSAMKISVVKMDNTSFDVAVLNSATVKDLKLAIRKKINEMEQEQMGHRHISWRHVWANFCLVHHNEKLIDDNSLLCDYGIRNNSKVIFPPYVMSRESRKHSRRRKHRFFHGLNRCS